MNCYILFQGEERARRNALSEELVEHFFENVNTLYEGFMRGVQLAGNKNVIFGLVNHSGFFNPPVQERF